MLHQLTRHREVGHCTIFNQTLRLGVSRSQLEFPRFITAPLHDRASRDQVNG
jgi:hypothetical protein